MSDDTSPEGGNEQTVVGPVASERAPVTPAVDDVFDLLAHDRRRDVCLFLTRTDRSVVTVDELAAALAVDADRERLAVDLHHRHLPKLAAAGVVDYDPRSTTARYWGQPTVEKWAEHAAHVEGRAGDER
ncbi:MAG: hypothetical protein ABEJ30_06820 [Halorientalis sp.]